VDGEAQTSPLKDSVATQGVVTTTCVFLTAVSETPDFSKPMAHQSLTGRNHKRGVCSIPTAPANQRADRSGSTKTRWAKRGMPSEFDQLHQELAELQS
jgi:hypothetical protein